MKKPLLICSMHMYSVTYSQIIPMEKLEVRNANGGGICKAKLKSVPKPGSD